MEYVEFGKICKRCAKLKTADLFRGGRSMCWSCEQEVKREWRTRPEVIERTKAYNTAYCGSEEKRIVEQKVCTACGELKTKEFFGRNKLTSDGLGSWCKRCVADRVRERRREDPELRAKESAYAKSDIARSYQKAYRATDRGRELRKLRDKRAYAKPENEFKIKARKAVSHAIERGQLIRPETCACGASPVTAHHHRGYDEEFWLDVKWLCIACHRLADSEMES